MSSYRREGLIHAPLETVWELISDPRTHPGWWPRVVEVRGERFELDDTYAQVTQGPMGEREMTLRVETLDELKEVGWRCQNTGTFAHWRLTDAQGGTFAEIELGMEPNSARLRLFDATWGKSYFRAWAEESLEALRNAAGDDQP